MPRLPRGVTLDYVAVSAVKHQMLPPMLFARGGERERQGAQSGLGFFHLIGSATPVGSLRKILRPTICCPTASPRPQTGASCVAYVLCSYAEQGDGRHIRYTRWPYFSLLELGDSGAQYVFRIRRG